MSKKIINKLNLKINNKHILVLGLVEENFNISIKIHTTLRYYFLFYYFLKNKQKFKYKNNIFIITTIDQFFEKRQELIITLIKIKINKKV